MFWWRGECLIIYWLKLNEVKLFVIYNIFYKVWFNRFFGVNFCIIKLLGFILIIFFIFFLLIILILLWLLNRLLMFVLLLDKFIKYILNKNNSLFFLYLFKNFFLYFNNIFFFLFFVKLINIRNCFIFFLCLL